MFASSSSYSDKPDKSRSRVTYTQRGTTQRLSVLNPILSGFSRIRWHSR